MPGMPMGGQVTQQVQHHVQHAPVMPVMPVMRWPRIGPGMGGRVNTIPPFLPYSMWP